MFKTLEITSRLEGGITNEAFDAEEDCEPGKTPNEVVSSSHNISIGIYILRYSQTINFGQKTEYFWTFSDIQRQKARGEWLWEKGATVFLSKCRSASNRDTLPMIGIAHPTSPGGLPPPGQSEARKLCSSLPLVNSRTFGAASGWYISRTKTRKFY